MGRKKGRQAGNFQSKSQHATYRQTVYVDLASEADRYRNPVPADLGRGHGYRNAASPRSDGYGGGGNGEGGGDKWSSIFSSSSSSRSTSSAAAAHDVDGGSGSENRAHAMMGLSRLRFLLEERRSEDRMHDRQHRLRLQRSRVMMASSSSDHYGSAMSPSSVRDKERMAEAHDEHGHEAGWLLSHAVDSDDESTPHDTTRTGGDARTCGIPALQTLAARALGPLLPTYCAACGSDFVGESLRAVPGRVLSDLSIFLATAGPSGRSGGGNDATMCATTTTDGAAKSLVRSGTVSGLVLRGAPLLPLKDGAEIEEEGEEEDDARPLSDRGLLSLCPRIDNNAETIYGGNGDDDGDDLGRESNCDHWETLDFDAGLNSRMGGCFHLKRLELVDIPLRQSRTASGGISISALRTVLRSCSNITHLSLGGCFCNWDDADHHLSTSGEESEDIGSLLGGNPRASSLARSFRALSALHGDCDDDEEDQSVANPIQQLLFRRTFADDNEEENDVPGLDRYLPELRLLDVSRCGWVTDAAIAQFLLNSWGRVLVSAADRRRPGGNDGPVVDGVRWADEDENENARGDRVDATIDDGELRPPGNRTGSPNDKECLAKICTSLRHLNVRGCAGLLPESSDSPSWTDQWRRHGLFEGICVSTDRQVRKR